MSPATIADQIRARGYALLPDAYSARAIQRISETLDSLYRRYGEPELTARDAKWLDEGVELAPPGLAIYGLLGFAPELGPDLFRPQVVDVLRELLGEDMHLELVGAVLSDHTRPFTEWESHAGGIDDERWRRSGHRPRLEKIVRVAHFVFLDPLDEHGPWQVLPRRVGDPVEPAGDLQDPHWPGAERIVAEPGTVLLLEESVWHSVLPLCRRGTRRFVGSYFAARHAHTTVGRDASLDRLPAEHRDALLDSLLSHRSDGR